MHHHTDNLTEAHLKELASHESDLCLTLTLPMVVNEGAEARQNPIRFENAIQEAKEKLEKIGMRGDEIESFLAPLKEKHLDSPYWETQEEGLLVCRSKDICEFYRLPVPFKTNVIVDKRFYLRPLIPHMQNGETVHLLLLQEEGTTLVSGNFFQTEPDIHALPEDACSFDNYLKQFDFEKSLQFEGGNAQPKALNFHGQGAAGDESSHRTYLEEYLKKVQGKVAQAAREQDIKHVFLVAEPQIDGLYAKNARETGRPDVTLLAHSNPDSKPVREWVYAAIASQKQERDRRQKHNTQSELARLENQNPDLAKNTVDEIVAAACNQRIDTLMITPDSQDYVWGRFDPEYQSVRLQEKDESESGVGEELINLAAIKTLLGGGQVMHAESQDNGSGIYAICRW